MSDKDIGKALLQLDAANLANVPDVREQVARVLQRDQRRVKLWTLVTAGLWLLAVTMVMGILIFLGLLFPMWAKLKAGDGQDRINAQERQQLLEEADIAFKMVSVLIAASVGVLAAAALSTVFLLFASRRATLRQVSANLLEVCEQIKQLREAIATRPPAG
jgi:ABC-type phosphate/phosphonate transport system permease subunit